MLNLRRAMWMMGLVALGLFFSGAAIPLAIAWLDIRRVQKAPSHQRP